MIRKYLLFNIENHKKGHNWWKSISLFVEKGKVGFKIMLACTLFFRMCIVFLYSTFSIDIKDTFCVDERLVIVAVKLLLGGAKNGYTRIHKIWVTTSSL